MHLLAQTLFSAPPHEFPTSFGPLPSVAPHMQAENEDANVVPQPQLTLQQPAVFRGGYTPPHGSEIPERKNKRQRLLATIREDPSMPNYRDWTFGD